MKFMNLEAAIDQGWKPAPSTTWGAVVVEFTRPSLLDRLKVRFGATSNAVSHMMPPFGHPLDQSYFGVRPGDDF